MLQHTTCIDPINSALNLRQSLRQSLDQKGYSGVVLMDLSNHNLFFFFFFLSGFSFTDTEFLGVEILWKGTVSA